MKLHPRYRLVEDKIQAAEIYLSVTLQDLTEGEFIKAVSEISHSLLSGLAKHKIRHERHTEDPTKEGDIE